MDYTRYVKRYLTLRQFTSFSKFFPAKLRRVYEGSSTTVLTGYLNRYTSSDHRNGSHQRYHTTLFVDERHTSTGSFSSLQFRHLDLLINSSKTISHRLFVPRSTVSYTHTITVTGLSLSVKLLPPLSPIKTPVSGTDPFPPILNNVLPPSSTEIDPRSCQVDNFVSVPSPNQLKKNHPFTISKEDSSG